MDKPKPKRRWFQLTPDRFMIGLLAVEGFLLLSEWFCWFPFNEKKGWTVLIALTAMSVGCLLPLLWFAVSLLLGRRFQFGLRSLLVMVLVIAVACSWLTVKVQQTTKQREAVEAIEKAGGFAAYDYEVDDYGLFAPPAEPPLPAWLLDLLGKDLFFEVSLVLTEPSSSPDFSDEDLMHLAELTTLEFLHLSGTQVTDSGLVHLKRLTNLQVLRLGETQVTDAGLVHLKGLTNLEGLDLSFTQVTDAGLEHVEALTNLEYLFLHGTPVTDEGVENLRRALPNCYISK